MQNIFTSGSEGIELNIVTNEDKTLICQVINYNSENKVVEAKKVWDAGGISTTIPLYAYNKDKYDLISGQIVLFYRVGDFNTNPRFKPSEFELHKKNSAKISWLCLSYSPFIFVRDKGNNKAEEVIYNGTKFIKPTYSVTLPIIATDQSSSYHGGTPPFKVGRVYWAQRVANIYVCLLPGFGKIDKTLETNIFADLFLDMDASGKLINFRSGARGWQFQSLITDVRGYCCNFGYNNIIVTGEKKGWLFYLKRISGTDRRHIIREYDDGWQAELEVDNIINVEQDFHLSASKNRTRLIASWHNFVTNHHIKVKVKDTAKAWSTTLDVTGTRIGTNHHCAINDNNQGVLLYTNEFFNSSDSRFDEKLCVRHWNAGTWGAEVILDTVFTDFYRSDFSVPVCKINSSGHILVFAWYIHGLSGDTWEFRAFIYKGSEWSSSTDLKLMVPPGVMGGNFPDVLADFNDNGKGIVLFWERESTASSTLVTRAAYYNGTAWETTTTLSTNANDDLIGCKINNNNQAYLVWKETDSGSSKDQYIANHVNDGTYGTNTTVMEVATSSSWRSNALYPSLSNVGNGLLAINENDGTNEKIYGKFLKNYVAQSQHTIVDEAIENFSFNPRNTEIFFDMFNDFALLVFPDVDDNDRIRCFKYEGV